MGRLAIQPTGRERFFDQEEIIVSKTDQSGRLTYVNDVFTRISLYDRAELVGAAHSLIRHPDMPRSVFRLMWDTIQAGEEMFAYVKNLCSNGDHYWVFAHITPTFGAGGAITGYHSNRRCPERDAVAAIEALYARVRGAEQGHPSKESAVAAGLAMVNTILNEQGRSYDEFVWSL